MKKYTLLLVLFYGTSLAAAENPPGFRTAAHDSTKIGHQKMEFGARSGFYWTNSHIAELCYYGYFTLRKGIHEVSVGPSLERPFKWNGVDFTYRILPNGPGKVFDFYFQLDYFQKWDRRTLVSIVYPYPNSYQYTTDNVRYRANASQLLLEYGFDIRFLKHFYLGMGLGIGGQIVFKTYDYAVYSEMNHKTTGLDLDFIFRTNVGFRF